MVGYAKGGNTFLPMIIKITRSCRGRSRAFDENQIVDLPENEAVELIMAEAAYATDLPVETTTAAPAMVNTESPIAKALKISRRK